MGGRKRREIQEREKEKENKCQHEYVLENFYYIHKTVTMTYITNCLFGIVSCLSLNL